jgi:hypothetical protein
MMALFWHHCKSNLVSWLCGDLDPRRWQPRPSPLRRLLAAPRRRTRER